MKRNAKTVIAGLVALAMSQAAFAKDIKVAVVGAMSGPVAQWGDMEFNGARQAIKDINAQGGIKGDKLVAVEYDDACDPKQAVAVANKIVNDGIQYVIGHLFFFKQKTAYEMIRQQLIKLMEEEVDYRHSVTAEKYIREKTRLSRSGVMRILAALKTGGFIEMEEGKLIKINKLPAKY